MSHTNSVVVASSTAGHTKLNSTQYLLSLPNLERVLEYKQSVEAMLGVAHASKLEIQGSSETIAKLRHLPFANLPVEFLEIPSANSSFSGGLEFTCMDRRLHSLPSAQLLSGLPVVTWPASALFLHPEISKNLEKAGLDYLYLDLRKVFQQIQNKGWKIAVLSNHHGTKGDAGCGGLGVLEEKAGFEMMSSPEKYRKFMLELRDYLNLLFGGIAENARLISYATENGVIATGIDLESEDEFRLLV